MTPKFSHSAARLGKAALFVLAPSLAFTLARADTWNVEASQDTFVASFQPTTSYGSSTAILVGYSSSSPTSHYRGYVQFPLPSNLAGSVVNSANLQMTGTNQPASFDYVFRVSMLNGSWADSITWNTQPAAASTLYITKQISPTTSTSKTHSFDVTELVQFWADGEQNNGLMIRRDPENATNAYLNLVSLQGTGTKPTLVINYTPPAPVTTLHYAIPDSSGVYRGETVSWTYRISTNQYTSLLLGGSLNSGSSPSKDLHYLSSPARTITADGAQHSYTLSNVAIRANAPSGTSLGIIAALWRDTNSSGYIDAGDVQAGSTYTTSSGSVTVDSSYVAHMGNASASISPSGTLTPGQAITVNFSILSWGSANLLLGANFGTGLDIGQTPVSLVNGWNNVSLSGTVPSGITSGAYPLRALLWQDLNRSGSIDAGDLPLPADQSGNATPSTLISNVNVSLAPSNTLGMDTSHLDGKKVRGPIFLGSPSNSVSMWPWSWFYIKQGTTTLAQAHIAPNQNATLNDIPWRKPDGTYVSQWSDIISGTTALTVVGYDTVGQDFSSAPFTVTPQTALIATITPPGSTFPSFSSPLTPTFTGTPGGGSGSYQYAWYYRSTTASSSGSSFSPTFDGKGAHVVTFKVSDTNNNVTYVQYVAPIGYRPVTGDPVAAGTGSTLVGPVDVVSGNLHLAMTDLAVPGYGVPFQLTRCYNTGLGTSYQWRFNVEEYAISGVFSDGQNTLVGRSVLIFRADGTRQEFYLDESGNYRPLNPGNFDVISESGVGSSATLSLFERDGTESTFVRAPSFTTSARPDIWILKSVKSPRGLGWTITHNSSVANYTGFFPQITNVTDAAGRTYSFTYDAAKHINRVDDPTGRYVTYTWDANHNITEARDVRGYTTQFFYRTADPGNKCLLRVVRPRGNQPLNSVTYDSSKRVISFADGDSFTTAFDFSDSNATVVTPPVAAEKARFAIDPSTQVITSVIEAFGTGNYTTTLDHRTANFDNTRIADYGLLSRTVDPATRETSISYLDNPRGQVRTTIAPGSRTTTYSWQDLNTAKNLAAVTNVNTPQGRNYGATPNSYGEIVGTTDPASNASSIVYNSLGLPQSMTDALSRTTSFGYDSYGNVTSITDHTGAIAYLEYSVPRNGFPTRVTDRRGYRTDYTYDNAGNVLTKTDHLGNQVVNSYDANGNLASTQDRRSNTTTLAYNNRDLLSSVSRTAPVNGTSTTVTEYVSFDGMGRIDSLRNGRGNITYRYYNSRGLLSSVVNGAGEEVLSLTYNTDGTVNTQTTGSGTTKSTLTFGYDSAGRRTTVTDSLGNQVILTYNSDNQVTKQRDARGNETIYGYDTAARLATVTTPTSAGNATASAFYDAIGRLTEVRDPLGHSTTYSFDDPNRRVTERDHSNRTWVRAFDAEENLTSENFPDGRQFSYSYDALGRLDYLNYGNGRFADPTYDVDSNMTALADHLGTTNFAYDSLSRLTSVTDPFGQAVSYWYDAASNITRITYPGSGKVVSYTFDNAERMKTVLPWTGGTFTYTWRTDNLPSRIMNGNSTYTDYGYDAAARLTSLGTRNASGTAFITQNLTLDANGNITGLHGDQPTAPPSDASKSMTYDVTNRLLTDGGSSVVHDAAGRLTSNPAGTGGTATWEGRDWLAAFTPTGGNPTTYSYNGLGQRLSRAQSGNTARYVLDLNQSLPAVLVENNGSNTPQRYYIHGAAGLLASIDTGNTLSTYHFNHRGDTLALTNASGTVVESYGYSPYGVTTASNATSTNPFRFIGQYGVMDEGNGLHFMRARYYASSISRLLSLDQFPPRIDPPGSLNRLAYVNGNPIMWIDPSGLTIAEIQQLLKKTLNFNNRKAAQIAAELVSGADDTTVESISRSGEELVKYILERSGASASFVNAFTLGSDMYSKAKALLGGALSVAVIQNARLGCILSQAEELIVTGQSWTGATSISELVDTPAATGGQAGLVLTSDAQKYALEQFLLSAARAYGTSDERLAELSRGMLLKKKTRVFGITRYRYERPKQ